MLKWFADFWPTVVGILASISALFGSWNLILTIKRQRLMIKELEKRLEDGERQIVLPTVKEIIETTSTKLYHTTMNHMTMNYMKPSRIDSLRYSILALKRLALKYIIIITISIATVITLLLLKYGFNLFL